MIPLLVEGPPVDPETGGPWDRDRIFKAQELEDAWTAAKEAGLERDKAVAARAELNQAYARLGARTARIVQRIYNLRGEHPELPEDVRAELLDIAITGTPEEMM